MSIQANINSLMGMIGSAALKTKGYQMIKGTLEEQELAKAKQEAAEYEYEVMADTLKEEGEPKTSADAEFHLQTHEQGTKVLKEKIAKSTDPEEQEQLQEYLRDAQISAGQAREKKQELQRKEGVDFAAKRARAEEEARYQVQEEQERIRKARETSEESIRLREKIMRGGI